MQSVSLIVAVIAVCVIGASARVNTTLGHALSAQVGSLPSELQIEPTAVYQSSNGQTIFLQTNVLSNPIYFAYSPNAAALMSPYSGLPANTPNENHIDQLFYDGTSNSFMALMEIGLRGGVGQYYPKRITSSGRTAWEDQSLSLHRSERDNTATLGVVGGVVVALHDTGRGHNFVELIAMEVLTGKRIYTKKYWQRLRCNPVTNVCIAVGLRIDVNEVMLFHAQTGATILSKNFEKDDSPHLGVVLGPYIVMTTNGQAYSVDTSSGAIKKIGQPSGGGVGFTQYGPNLARPRRDGWHVYSIASSQELVSGLQADYILANYQIIAIPVGEGNTRTWECFNATDGSKIASILLKHPTTDLNWGPFLIGHKIIIPYSSASYQITDVRTQKSTMASYLAGQFSGNVIYLASGNTFMWNVNEFILFGG